MKEKELDNHKIAFIMCANNEAYVEESSFYLNRLEIPDDYNVEYLIVRDATSMTAGYNEAMNSSDAKYKIYLHQDVFVINQRFLYELLDVFFDNSIGLVGVVGGKRLPSNGSFVANWDTRCTYLCNSRVTSLFYDGFENLTDFEDVSVVDGMLMATQYDIPWDETFDAWDYYDVSQSILFKEHGYRVVAAQGQGGKAWCIHDEGYCVPRHYDKYRKLFCDRFKRYGFEYDRDDTKRTNILTRFDKEKRKMIEEGLTIAGDFQKKVQSIERLEKYLVEDTDLSYWRQIVDIYSKEMSTNGASIFWPTSDLEESMNIYRMIKFLLWRMELECDYQDYSVLFDWIKERIVSVTALAEIVKYEAFDGKKAWEKVLEMVQGNKR